MNNQKTYLCTRKNKVKDTMQIIFYKYQGTGNDFILIDNRKRNQELSQETIEKLCDRRFGIGADGLMLLQEKEGFDFEMVYYNADGRLGSMCGNGGRCIVAFAQFLGVLKNEKAYFLAVDGSHEAVIKNKQHISLKMIDVSSEHFNPSFAFLNTGSPHHIEFVSQIEGFDIYNKGKAIRYSDIYKEKGTNVNFVEIIDNQTIKVATYERGVEDETLSCGTGVTAAAMAWHLKQAPTKESNVISIQTKGGNLEVRFQYKNNLFYDVWLSGPAEQVFSGSISI